MRYEKPVCTSEEHVKILRQRGLLIPDEEKACRYLTSIGYYRLSAYFLPFHSQKDVFSPGAEFDNILALYIFDRKLRLLTMDIVGRCEIAIRTCILNTMSVRYNNAHWYMQPELFKDPEEFNKLLKEIRKITPQKEKCPQSFKHYYEKYSEPDLPPSWMVAEVLPMGSWSHIYRNLKDNNDRREIAAHFRFTHTDFQSWLHALTLIRNCLAHHNRFWNTIFPPKAKNIAKYSYDGLDVQKPYTNFVLVYAFLKTFTNNSHWPDRLEELLDTCPLNICRHMGFPLKWRRLKFWETQ